MADEMTPRASTRPDPDPTAATLELVESNTRSLKELMASRDEVTQARLNAMDKAVTLIGTYPTAIDVAVNALRALHDEKFVAVNHAREAAVAAINERIAKTDAVAEQRFQRIDGAFIERDKRSEQLSLANSTAVSAALQAQKESAADTNRSSALAISKSDSATLESIKSLQTLFQTAIASQAAMLQDLKSRLDRGEGSSSVADPATTMALTHLSETVSRLSTGANRGEGAAQAKSDNTAWIFGIVAVVIAIGTLLVDVLWLHSAGAIK